MTAPAYFVAACIAAAAVAIAHFIVLREPPGAELPTARFVPAGSSVVRMLTRKPVDPWLLAARAGAVLLLGLAFARPHLPHRRVPLVSIVAIDRSRAVRDIHEAVDSAGAVRAGAPGSVPVLVAFDSTGTIVTDDAAADTLSHLRPSDATGSLTSAIVSAIRVAAQWHARTDSIELTVVSPVRGDEVDAALAPVRAMWPGAVRLVRVAPAIEAQSAVASSPIIVWPADGHVSLAMPRTPPDTVGAVSTGDVVIVRSFVRQWQPDTAGARIIGRWVDGEPAIVERKAASGCTREVAVAIDTVNAALRDPTLARLIRALHTSCGAPIGRAVRKPPDGLWGATNKRFRVPADAFASVASESTAVPIILLVLALIVLAAESALRRRVGRLRAA